MPWRLLTALTRLDANCCSKLPDLAVESVVGSCLALEHLGLKGCSALVSPTIQSAKLRSLDVSLCGKLVRYVGGAGREEGREDGGAQQAHALTVVSVIVKGHRGP